MPMTKEQTKVFSARIEQIFNEKKVKLQERYKLDKQYASKKQKYDAFKSGAFKLRSFDYCNKQSRYNDCIDDFFILDIQVKLDNQYENEKASWGKEYKKLCDEKQAILDVVIFGDASDALKAIQKFQK